MGSSKKTQQQPPDIRKPGLVGYVVLILAICFFSGVFGDLPGAWKVLDFSAIFGQYGKVAADASPGFVGSGGTGVRQGFAQSLSIAPGVWLAVGVMEVMEHLGGLKAAEQALSPLLRIFLGTPGIGALPVVASWQSSDAAAVVTKNLVDQKTISEDQRDVLAMYQFSADACVGMYYAHGALLFSFLVKPIGVGLLVIMIMKVVGANVLRLYIRWTARRETRKDRYVSEGA